jgi:hypothetical protein
MPYAQQFCTTYAQLYVDTWGETYFHESHPMCLQLCTIVMQESLLMYIYALVFGKQKGYVMLNS